METSKRKRDGEDGLEEDDDPQDASALEKLDKVKAHLSGPQRDPYQAIEALTNINYQFHEEINVLRAEVAGINKRPEQVAAADVLDALRRGVATLARGWGHAYITLYLYYKKGEYVRRLQCFYDDIYRHHGATRLWTYHLRYLVSPQKIWTTWCNFQLLPYGILLKTCAIMV
jgi:hypothetical protein